MAKPVLLCILDGWGLAADGPSNAVSLAETPHLDRLFADSPHSTLSTSGEAVGLPAGQQGNSEVGHLNLGAGRVVYQDLLRIDRDIADGTFFKNDALSALMMRVHKREASLHLMGLLSDGGVHSHQDHLLALLSMAKAYGVKNIFVHAFLDGRDVPPDSAAAYLKNLEDHLIQEHSGQIASICGRYYAMDRDKRYERVQRAWAMLMKGEGKKASSASEAIQKSYEIGIYDEFVEPTVIINNDGAPLGVIQDGDGLIFFNYRADRAREITHALANPHFDGFVRDVCPVVDMVALTEYEAGMDDFVTVAYPPLHLQNTLGAWLSAHQRKQLRTAETEKYAHVTFFFNGGVEEPDDGEERVLVPSPKVATYDLQPEMSAAQVGDEVVKAIRSEAYDFILVNFANPDMVGHTGVLEAAIAAMSAVDVQMGRIVSALDAVGGVMLVCADHGNCECMADESGHPVTSHTTNSVPLILYGMPKAQLKDGSLCDVAPTVLALMDLSKPPEMTGQSLVQ